MLEKITSQYGTSEHSYIATFIQSTVYIQGRYKHTSILCQVLYICLGT